MKGDYIKDCSTVRSVHELLADLDVYTGRSKRELVYEAVDRREEIVPHLLSHVQDVIANPEDYIEHQRDLLPYALILLAYFKEERSHPLIIELFRKPEGVLHDLVGDMTTNALPVLLIRTGGGSVDGLKQLILDHESYDFVRWASMEGLVAAVAAGMADRDETIAFLAGLLTGEEAENGSHFWSGVANSLCDLHAADVMDDVHDAYDRGLIYPHEISKHDFENASDPAGIDRAMENLRQQLTWQLPDDIDALIMFCEGAESAPISAPTPTERPDKKKQTQKKAKNKMAKKSRRKNR